jgi:hypothetical protein
MLVRHIAHGMLTAAEGEEENIMRGCVGSTDRIVRILVGVIALAIGLTQIGSLGSGWAVVADAVGVIGLATGLFGRCPLYAVLGVQTCKETA